MTRALRILLALPLLAIVACQDGPVVHPEPLAGPAFAFNLTSGFHFLPPVGSAVSTAAFLGHLSPTVVVCKWSGGLNGSCATGSTVAAFTRTSGTGGATIQANADNNSYQVDWKTSDSPIVRGETYQIVVQLGGRALGMVDVALFANMNEARRASGGAMALVAGRTLPISFGFTSEAVFAALDVPPAAVASNDFVIQTFTTDGSVQEAETPSGDAAFQVDTDDVQIPGGGSDFTIVIFERELVGGKCITSYPGPQAGGCYEFRTLPDGVTFYENGDPSRPVGIAGVCRDSNATPGMVLAKEDDGVVTYPSPSVINVVQCDGLALNRLPRAFRALAELLLPKPLHAGDEGESGTVGVFSTIFWADELGATGTSATDAYAPGEQVTMTFRVVGTHVHDEPAPGVAGVAVNFSAPDGGSVAPATGTTDSDGYLSTVFTVPASAGAKRARAEIVGVSDPGTTADATATVGNTFGTVFYSTSTVGAVGITLKQNATIVDNTTTRSNGKYAFANVAPGSYQVEVTTVPSGYIILDPVSTITVGTALVPVPFRLLKQILPVSPTPGGNAGSPQPTLSWTTVAEAASYLVTVKRVSDNVTIVNGATVPTNSYAFQTPLTPGESYTWSVMGRDGAGNNVGFMSPRTFTVQPGTVGGTVFYSTTGLAGVTVELVQGTDPLQPAFSTTTTGTNGGYLFEGVPAGTYEVKAYGPDNTYITWVSREITTTGQGAVVENIDMPKLITLQSPASGTAVDVLKPTLTWTSNPQATRYVLQLNRTSDWGLVEHVTNLTTNSHTVQATLYDRVNYTWQADAYDAANRHVGTTLTAFNFTLGAASYPDLPAPNLALESVTSQTTNGVTYTVYDFDVLNYSSFPDALFASAPDLTACGLNTNSSRSWVDIYDQNHNRLYGFCALGAAAHLDNIWFGWPATSTQPTHAYIKIVDRRSGLVYTSNLVPLVPSSTHQPLPPQ